MADELNIITSDANSVNVTTEERTITITNDSDTTTITLSNSETTTVQIATIGPQGPKGDTGNVNTGSLASTGSNIFIGNQIITGSINLTNGITGSLLGTASFATTASYALNAGAGAGFPYSGSAVITGSLLVTEGITGSLYGTASWSENYTETDPIYNAEKGKYLTTGSTNTSQTIVGSLVIDQNLTVLGSQSVQYITSSQLNIQTNIITVNTATPAIRFGGLSVIDSGSTGTGLTGSILWDSQNNVWIYTNPSGAAYDGGLLLTGPKNTSGIGNEVGITQNYLAKGDGSHHMTSSQISDDGANVTIPGNLVVNGSITGSFTGSVVGYVPNTATSSFIVNSQTASFATTGSNTFRGNQTITGSTNISGSLTITGSTNINGATGTTLFSSNADTLTITGSLIVSGSTTSIGTNVITGSFTVITGSSIEFQVTNTGVRIGNIVTDIHNVTGSLRISGSITGSLSGNVVGNLTGTSSWATNAITSITSSYPIAVTGTTIYSTAPLSTNNPNTSNNIFLGVSAGQSATSAVHSTFLGQQSGFSASNASFSNFLGLNVGVRATNANNSNFLGPNAGVEATNANSSNFIGVQAGYYSTNASQSNFLGLNAGNNATNAGSSNFIGYNAGAGSTNAAYSNFIGADAGGNAISASYSTLLGYQAGSTFTGNGIGSNNIIIGTNITLANNRQDSINIGGLIFGTGSYATTTGNPYSGSADGNIGINVPIPTRNFEVSGSVAFNNLSPATYPTVVSIDTSTGQLYYQSALSGSGGGTVIVAYTGSTVEPSAATLNFTGSGVTVTGGGGTATIEITGGGSGTGATILNTKIAPNDSGSILTFNPTTHYSCFIEYHVFFTDTTQPAPPIPIYASRAGNIKISVPYDYAQYDQQFNIPFVENTTECRTLSSYLTLTTEDIYFKVDYKVSTGLIDVLMYNNNATYDAQINSQYKLIDYVII